MQCARLALFVTHRHVIRLRINFVTHQHVICLPGYYVYPGDTLTRHHTVTFSSDVYDTSSPGYTKIRVTRKFLKLFSEVYFDSISLYSRKLSYQARFLYSGEILQPGEHEHTSFSWKQVFFRCSIVIFTNSLFYLFYWTFLARMAKTSCPNQGQAQHVQAQTKDFV